MPQNHSYSAATVLCEICLIYLYLYTFQVRKLLTLLDMNAIQDTQANRLSGGQKRKLSLGITFLGDPQVIIGCFHIGFLIHTAHVLTSLIWSNST